MSSEPSEEAREAAGRLVEGYIAEGIQEAIDAATAKLREELAAERQQKGKAWKRVLELENQLEEQT